MGISRGQVKRIGCVDSAYGAVRLSMKPFGSGWNVLLYYEKPYFLKLFLAKYFFYTRFLYALIAKI